MIKIILSGCNGKMGRVITELVSRRSDCTIVAGIDLNTDMNGGFPVFPEAAQCTVPADVIVDFSNPAAVLPLLDAATERQLPIVIATTGLDDEQVGRVIEATENIPVFYSANMSLGVNLMRELAKVATRVLNADFDIEIVERHHNQKLDAPSGTALMLADAISSVLEEKPVYVYDRHSSRKKRDKKEIGIHAVRGGTITGDHDIIFAGRDEVFTISHHAASREIFASGAVSAAVFLSGKPKGFYTMTDLIGKI